MRRKTSPDPWGIWIQDREVRHRCRTCHRLRGDCVERVNKPGSWDCQPCLEAAGQMRLVDQHPEPS